MLDEEGWNADKIALPDRSWMLTQFLYAVLHWIHSFDERTTRLEFALSENAYHPPALELHAQYPHFRLVGCLDFWRLMEVISSPVFRWVLSKRAFYRKASSRCELERSSLYYVLLLLVVLPPTRKWAAGALGVLIQRTMFKPSPIHPSRQVLICEASRLSGLYQAL